MKPKDRVFAPWERAFDRIISPIEDFAKDQTTSSIFLMLAVVIALFLANSPWAEAYFHFTHTHVKVEAFGKALDKSLHHWVNDGLMALFFFVVGLEIKRELLTGELSSISQAVTPIAAAIGGMAMPAFVYWLVNEDPLSTHGWGISMATDIAFAVAALMILGNRIPKSLVAFLIALAIVDDLGAVLVIAFFYTKEIAADYAIAAVIFTGLLVVLNLVGVRKSLPYFLVGVILWVALLKSGLHATLAGVITAFTIPSRPKYDPELFMHRLRRLINSYEEHYQAGEGVRRSQRLRGILAAMERGLVGIRTPAYRLEHNLHLPVALVIVPFFAFINSGIEIDMATLGEAASHSMPYAIVAGLFLGKPLGISLAVWLAVKSGVGELPQSARMMHIVGVGFLAGIGFTMSIFIGSLAFAGNEEFIDYSKIGIFCASILSAGVGLFILQMTTKQEG